MPKSFLATVPEVLRQRGPQEVFSLIAETRKLKPIKGRKFLLTSGRLTSAREKDFPLVREILECLKRGEHGFRVIEYPTYRLKSSMPETLPPGRYLRAALEALSEGHPLSLKDLAQRYEQKYRSAAVVAEFWMLVTMLSREAST